MNIDLASLIRRTKPHKRVKTLAVRPASALLHVSQVPAGRPKLVPDTNFYIRFAQGTLSSDAFNLFRRSIFYHCSVCLGEIAIGIGNKDPSHHSWRASVAYFEKMMNNIHKSRVIYPDNDLWLHAGMVAGIVTRCQNYQKTQMKGALNDALIYLTAARYGLPVLTENRTDFDYIQQLSPNGVFYYY